MCVSTRKRTSIYRLARILLSLPIVMWSGSGHGLHSLIDLYNIITAPTVYNAYNRYIGNFFFCSNIQFYTLNVEHACKCITIDGWIQHVKHVIFLDYRNVIHRQYYYVNFTKPIENSFCCIIHNIIIIMKYKLKLNK